MRCPNCDIETDQSVCPECGTTVLSDPDETMDALIEKASIPNLGALIKKGKEKGLIKPAEDYGDK